MDLFGEETEEEKKAAEERAAAVKASAKKKESEFYLPLIYVVLYCPLILIMCGAFSWMLVFRWKIISFDGHQALG